MRLKQSKDLYKVTQINPLACPQSENSLKLFGSGDSVIKVVSGVR